MRRGGKASHSLSYVPTLMRAVARNDGDVNFLGLHWFRRG